MPAPQEVINLVEHFQRNIGDYQSGKYNETQVRLQFIDPFFESLGWDVHNKKGYAEAYKDVVHEDQVKVGGATKAPDYGFRIGGVRKFFVEAKKPSINIKDDVHPAYQLRRYAWSAKLPVSILTDFEELAVYDCRIRPVKTDQTGTARDMYFTYGEYVEKWENIAAIFSREAVLQGSFDRYAESRKRKRGTAEVDTTFLTEIERWREILARNIALRNPGLTVRDLNFAVQRTIDRIIFLRIAEDRGLEPYGRLGNLRGQKNTYNELCRLYRRADERYNSSLFHFKAEGGRIGLPDELTVGLLIDDKVIYDILRNLYYPDSPYEFSVLPADILGQVYEQFLGKVIRLTAGGRAKVEDKPEVKKAGGVYYTPSYIVDYIVAQTVGKLLEGLKPRDASKLKICDPACGSGSFLLGAYQYILDWHRDYYVADDPEKWAKAVGRRAQTLYQAQGGEWRLTTAEKRRILLNNIYGVDIDPQAVEVTKLSLLLKVLEGENEGSLAQQLAFFQERALPDLGTNIKCGNSLIGTDFFYQRGQQLAMFDTEERYRINAFDWEMEFSKVMAAGGFDVVMGNPPYIRMEEFKELKSYLKEKYRCHDERSDIYTYFIEKGHKILRHDGYFGTIVSNKFLRANYGKPLRKFLIQSTSIDTIVDFAGLPVFKGATIRTIVLLTKRQEQINEFTYSPPLPVEDFISVESGTLSVEEAVQNYLYNVSNARLQKDVWSFIPQDVGDLIDRLMKIATPLREYCEGLICRGVVSGLTKAFVISEQTRKQIIAVNPKAIEIIKPFLNGRDIRRYHLEPKGQYLIYTYKGIDISQYPGVIEHLKPFKEKLLNRATRQEWYELQQPQHAYVPYFESPKIIFPDIAIHPRFMLDDIGYYGSNTIYFIAKRDLFLLGLLNSKLAYFYFKTICAGLEGKNETYLRFFGQYLQDFPIVFISDQEPHDKMELLVNTILELNESMAKTRLHTEKQMLERQIKAADNQIDRLVYELYGLTDEEIRIVEES